MQHIRNATLSDVNRLAEIEVFCYRLNFYPIFRNDDFYFDELTVPNFVKAYEEDPESLNRTWVYDDGVVKVLSAYRSNRSKSCLWNLFCRKTASAQSCCCMP